MRDGRRPPLRLPFRDAPGRIRQSMDGGDYGRGESLIDNVAMPAEPPQDTIRLTQRPRRRKAAMISKDDRIVTAFAEWANGPGWSNRPLWVIVCDQNQKLRQECIQPKDQTAAMHNLYAVSEAAHLAMTRAVESFVNQKHAR